VCEELRVLHDILKWFLAQARSPRFSCCRTKDRLSRDWDAEMSGGNRDVGAPMMPLVAVELM
jgi:hypothetical protein